MTSPAERDPNPPATAAPTAGAQLAAARESLGISLEDAATQLRLDARTVRMLEEDRARELPAPTYARGYLRAYARLVGLDPEPLLAASTPTIGAAPALRPTSSKPPAQARSGDRPVKLITYLLLAAVIILPALWWHARYFDVAEAPPPAMEPQLAAPAPPEPEPEPPRAGAALGYEYPLVIHPGSAAGNQPLPLPLQELPPAPGAAADDSGAELRPGEPAEPDGQAGAGISGPVPGAAAGAPEVATAGDRATLSLALSQDAWIEAYDADGARLYYDLARAGRTIEVEGHPPLRVLVGNSAHVVLRFRDQPVALGPFSVDGIARLVIDDSGPRAPD